MAHGRKEGRKLPGTSLPLFTCYPVTPCFSSVVSQQFDGYCDRVTFKLIKGLIVSAHLSKLPDTMCNGRCTGAGWPGSCSSCSVFGPHSKRTSGGGVRVQEMNSCKPFSSEHTSILFCWLSKMGVSPLLLNKKVTFTVLFVKGTILGYQNLNEESIHWKNRRAGQLALLNSNLPSSQQNHPLDVSVKAGQADHNPQQLSRALLCCFHVKIRSHHMAHASLELQMILLPPPFQCWDHSYALPHLLPGQGFLKLLF